MSKKIAIVFHTHFITNDILREFENISTESKEFADTYLLCDYKISDIPQNVKKYNYLCIDYDDISGLNYPIVKDEVRKAKIPMAKAARLNNYKFAILKFFLDKRDYEHYWYIEYDVRYSGKWSQFFKSFDNNNKDLLTSYLRYHEEEPQWLLWYLEHTDKTVPEAERIRSFNPVMRLSNKALAFLHESLIDGWIGHLEVLIPTLLYKNGFEIEDFGGAGHFCLEENINRHYIGSKNNLRGDLDHGTMRYKLHPIYLGLHRNKLYHPVKPFDVTIRYFFKRYKKFLKNKIKNL